MDPTLPTQLAALLRSARRVVALTGAGVSAESGIPTFRDSQSGLWARYRPEDLATPEAFRRNPRLVWQWYEWRRALVRQCSPNPGHYALADLQERLPDLSIVTQNVDGLHQRAGSTGVVELHGNLFRDVCQAEGRDVVPHVEIPGEEPPVPVCPDCGAPVRPGVVWFGETLPEAALAEALRRSRSCDLMLVVGTSGLVYPAAGLPAQARAAGARVVEINPEPSAVSTLCDEAFRCPSGALLAAVLEHVP